MPLVHNTLFDRLHPRQDRRAIHLDRLFNTSFPTGISNLVSTADPYSSNTAHKIALSREPNLVLGRIIEGIGYIKAYKVQLDRGGSVIICKDLTHTSLSVWGARQLNTYISGTLVWVLLAPHANHGVILGAVPDWMICANQAISDFVSQGSRIGLQVDQVHKYPFELNNAGGLVDWSAGRPSDSIHSGEWGAVTDTGLMFFMDPFMAMVRVDEETGAFFFYDDQLARFCGHNLEIRSSGYERTDDDDEWEYSVEEGYVPGYVWEGRGAFKPYDITWRELFPLDVQQYRQWYSRFEPFVDEQQPIRRTRIWHGYLGQSEKKTLFIPPNPLPSVSPSPPPPVPPDPPDQPPQSLETYPHKTKYPGVAEENWELDGSIGIRSAKSIIISKRMLIPQPKRIAHPEDVNADTTSNYKFDGIFGSGPDHKIGDIDDPSSDADPMPGSDKNELRCAAFMDYYAHFFNWKGLHPFHYHQRDWFMPQESDYDFASKMQSGNPQFDLLRVAGPTNEMTLQAPDAIPMYVDHRYGFVNYYPNNSHFALLESGEVLIGDGYGSELRMVGGYIFMTAPGGIYVLPGQDFEVWAGRNATMRAIDCCEIAAAHHDVRIKAQEKVLILGGNNVCGGVLIESRSPGLQFESLTDLHFPFQYAEEPNDVADEIVGGIVLRAPRAAICQYANIINMTTSHDGANGAIVMNANKRGVILELSDCHVSHFKTGRTDYFWDLVPAGVETLCSGPASCPAVPDPTEWNGPPDQVVYTITCTWPSGTDASTARVRVVSSAGDDSDDNVVPAPFGSPTYIGNRNFKLTFLGPTMQIGDTWCYKLCQKPPPVCETKLCGIHSLTCEGAYWNMPIWACNDAYFDKCVMVGGNVSTKGYISSSRFSQLTSNQYGPFDAASKQCADRGKALGASGAGSRYDVFWLQYNTDVLFVEFFFRSTYQNCIFDYEIFESRWHQMARAQGTPVSTWTEPPVIGMAPEGCMRGIPSYPHPGKKAWLDENDYVQEDLNMFQLASNCAVDRASPYENPAYLSPSRKSLDGNFIIIDGP
jgi:hypothetical protein